MCNVVVCKVNKNIFANNNISESLKYQHDKCEYVLESQISEIKNLLIRTKVILFLWTNTQFIHNDNVGHLLLSSQEREDKFW